MTKKIFKPNRISEILCNVLIDRANKSQRHRMRAELAKYMNLGYTIEQYEMFDAKRIILKSPDGKIIVISDEYASQKSTKEI
jgi:hypothetical protein